MLTELLCRWRHGLIFHQAVVDLLRSSLLLPLATSILHCRPIYKEQINQQYTIELGYQSI
jgi:hypothetical protein